MITSPLIALALALCALLTATVYALHVAQLCADRAAGIAHSPLPTRVLLAQQARAERTAAYAFGLAFLLAMALVGALEAGLA